MRTLVVLVGLVASLAAPPAARANVEDDVSARIARHQEPLRRCYRRALRDEPTLGRKLVVRFRVGRAGRAQTIRFDPRASTLRHAGVERCVARVLRRIRFRRLAEPTWFHSPLVFAAS